MRRLSANFTGSVLVVMPLMLRTRARQGGHLNLYGGLTQGADIEQPGYSQQDAGYRSDKDVTPSHP